MCEDLDRIKLHQIGSVINPQMRHSFLLHHTSIKTVHINYHEDRKENRMFKHRKSYNFSSMLIMYVLYIHTVLANKFN